MYIRFKTDNNEVFYGKKQDEKVLVIEGDIFSKYEVTGKTFPLQEVTLLSPVEPSKVVCIGLNYVDHAKEMNLEIPDEPLIFMKPSTSVIGTGEAVVYPNETDRLEYEAELAIVIGQKAKDVTINNASQYIFGYTIANDITARDIQFADGQWTRGKSFDTFCPVGPGIVTKINPNNVDISLVVNGEVKQQSNTKNLIFNSFEIVSYVSKMMTLLPGDLIITGTPHGVGSVKIGDEMIVEIEGIGQLHNKVMNEG